MKNIDKKNKFYFTKQLGVLEFILSAADPEEKVLKWREASSQIEDLVSEDSSDVSSDKDTAAMIARHILYTAERYTSAANSANENHARLIGGLDRLRTQAPYTLSLMNNRFYIPDTAGFFPQGEKENAKRAFAVALNSMGELNYGEFTAVCEPAAAAELERLNNAFDEFEKQAVNAWKNASIIPALDKFMADIDTLIEHDPKIKEAVSENVAAVKELCLNDDELARTVYFSWMQNPIPPVAYIPPDWNVMPLIAHTIDMSVDTYIKNRAKEIKKNLANKQQMLDYKLWELSNRISEITAQRSTELAQASEITVPTDLAAVVSVVKNVLDSMG